MCLVCMVCTLCEVCMVRMKCLLVLSRVCFMRCYGVV